MSSTKRRTLALASLRTRSNRFCLSSLYAIRPRINPAPTDSGLNNPSPTTDDSMPIMTTPP
ncbi:Uncharacterised protein [Mycobacterium tuberculosis]|uniref:Uncharacterized protein n=1 Tax=Mycobacterium tuberculosis TaxID=1773 RepID=A0A655FJG9_MYCTX|nr:Uncharacterised protein [Mycobacterium tuberculosis]COW53073.1 Uncharacterised protein [Mycobacterium tuberculosis]